MLGWCHSTQHVILLIQSCLLYALLCDRLCRITYLWWSSLMTVLQFNDSISYIPPCMRNHTMTNYEFDIKIILEIICPACCYHVLFMCHSVYTTWKHGRYNVYDVYVDACVYVCELALFHAVCRVLIPLGAIMPSTRLPSHILMTPAFT